MKPEIHFGLEQASWPAFLVDASGVIRRASQAAAAVFGPVVTSDAPHLSFIWAPENEGTAENFLTRIERVSTTLFQLKFRVKGGTTPVFSTHVCTHSRDGHKHFILQLFPSPVAAPPAPPAPPAPLALAPEASPEAKGQLAEAAAQKQKLECALQLTRTVALDFNNALTSILGHTSLLLSQMEPWNPWRRSLAEIEKSAEKAAEIAADLAAFSRQEKDAKTQQAGNLNTLLRRCVELFQKPGGSGPSFNLDLESRIYTVNFDEAKMQQALVKIIENAVQSIASDRPGNIFIHSRNLDLTSPTQDKNAHLAAGSYVCVEIGDDGCGMPQEVLSRMFEPFFTTKPGHRGLGLAWVYGIITNHGGTVAVSSEPGQGSTIRVYLPAIRKVVKDAAHAETDLTGSQTILIVDDEDLLLTMGQMVLTSYGYRVLTANSGQKALEIFTRERDNIHMVITDLVMPKMSGRELSERIRELAPNTLIIYSSGYVRPKSDEEENYLQKPFTSQDLLLKVKQALSTS